MTRQTRNRRKFPSLFLVTASCFGLQAIISGQASADTLALQVGGTARLNAGVHVNVDGLIGAVNTVVGAVSSFEAGISVGIGFSHPPPPPPVPSYYYGDYVEPAPVYQPPQPLYIDQPVIPRPAPMRRWGLGIFAGSVQVDDEDVASDLGLVGRYRFARSWAVEAEVAKSESTGGARVDRRLGGALVWNLPMGNRLKPSLLLGAGYGQSRFGKGELHALQGYGEIGAGLQYRLTKSLYITADVRAGTRTTHDDAMVTAKGGAEVPDEEENYSRARLGGMFFF